MRMRRLFLLFYASYNLHLSYSLLFVKSGGFVEYLFTLFSFFSVIFISLQLVLVMNVHWCVYYIFVIISARV